MNKDTKLKSWLAYCVYNSIYTEKLKALEKELASIEEGKRKNKADCITLN